MATVPSSILKRRSGPPAPPAPQATPAGAVPDPAGVSGRVIDAGASAPSLPTKDQVTAEQQEVSTILNAYVAVLPSQELLGVIAQTLAIASVNLSPRALAVLSPVIVDFTVHAQNILVNGNPSNPVPLSFTQSYVKNFVDFLKTQGAKDIQHLVTGLQDSLLRQEATHSAKEAQSDRVNKDVSRGYPHLIQQLSAVSERIATLGPIRWGQLAETAKTQGMDEISALLADSSRKTYQGQQQLEVEAKAAHVAGYHGLDSRKRSLHNLQMTSALLAGAKAALSQGTDGSGLSYDSIQTAMTQGVKSAFTKELKRLAQQLLSRKQSAKKTPSKSTLGSLLSLPSSPSLAPSASTPPLPFQFSSPLLEDNPDSQTFTS